MKLSEVDELVKGFFGVASVLYPFRFSNEFEIFTDIVMLHNNLHEVYAFLKLRNTPLDFKFEQMTKHFIDSGITVKTWYSRN